MSPARPLTFARRSPGPIATTAPTQELVFNAHSHYEVPSEDVAKLAKTLELMRLFPSESLVFGGPALQIHDVKLLHQTAKPPKTKPREGDFPFVSTEPPESWQSEKPLPMPKPVPPGPLEFHFRADNPTALVVPLPEPAAARASRSPRARLHAQAAAEAGPLGPVGRHHLPAQWLPVLAVYDDTGWQPTPFIPWHQPFFNEAGVYTASVDPAGRPEARLHRPHHRPAPTWATAGSRSRSRPTAVRDFALLGSARFEEFAIESGRGRRRRSQVVKVPGLPRARVLRPGDAAHRQRGHPRLQPVVRPLSLSRTSPSPSRTSAGTATSAAAWS